MSEQKKVEPEKTDVPKERIRTLIQSIHVSKNNIDTISEHGIISGSLYSTLYDILLKYEKELADLRAELKFWKTECDLMTGERDKLKEENEVLRARVQMLVKSKSYLSTNE